MTSEDSKRLIAFYRTLADHIEKGDLSPVEMASAGEIFMHSKFNTAVKDSDQLEEEDMKKYLVTGWYIHNKIVPQMQEDKVPVGTVAEQVTVAEPEVEVDSSLEPAQPKEVDL